MSVSKVSFYLSQAIWLTEFDRKLWCRTEEGSDTGRFRCPWGGEQGWAREKRGGREGVNGKLHSTRFTSDSQVMLRVKTVQILGKKMKAEKA